MPWSHAIATKKRAGATKSIDTLAKSRIIAGRKKSKRVFAKNRKNAVATMIKAGCLLFDHAKTDREKRAKAKMPLPSSNSSTGSVGMFVIVGDRVGLSYFVHWGLS